MSTSLKDEENSLSLFPNQNNSTMESADREIFARLKNNSTRRQQRNLKTHTDEQLRIVSKFIGFTEEIQQRMEFLDEEFTKRTGITLQERRSEERFCTEEARQELQIFVKQMSALIAMTRTTPLLKQDLEKAYEEVRADYEKTLPNTSRRNFNASFRKIFSTDDLELFTFPAGCLPRICLRASTIEELKHLLEPFMRCGMVILPHDSLLKIFIKMSKILGALLVPMQLVLGQKIPEDYSLQPENQILKGISLQDLFIRFNFLRKEDDERREKYSKLKKSRVQRPYCVTEDGIEILAKLQEPENQSENYIRKALLERKKKILFYKRVAKETARYCRPGNVLLKSDKKIFFQEMQHPRFGYIATEFQFICDRFQEQVNANSENGSLERSIFQETFREENKQIIEQNATLLEKNTNLVRENTEISKENLLLKSSMGKLLQEKILREGIIVDLSERIDSYPEAPYEKRKIILLLKAASKSLLRESQVKIAERLQMEGEYSNLLEKLSLIPSRRLNSRNLKKLQELMSGNAPHEEISLLKIRNKTLEFYLNLLKNENLSLGAEIQKLKSLNIEENLPNLEPSRLEESILIEEESVLKKDDLPPMEEEVRKISITPENAMNESWFCNFVNQYKNLNEKTTEVNKMTLALIENKRSLEKEIQEYKKNVKSLQQEQKENKELIAKFKKDQEENKALIEDLRRELTKANQQKEIRDFSSNSTKFSQRKI